MAPMPAYRLAPQRIFALTGVDFAGPFQIRMSKGRGYKSTKGYIAIFVCMVIKAVHIEPVSDLTSEAFLAAYNRFTARRGVCNTIFSNNATKLQRGISRDHSLIHHHFINAREGCLHHSRTRNIQELHTTSSQSFWRIMGSRRAQLQVSSAESHRWQSTKLWGNGNLGSQNRGLPQYQATLRTEFKCHRWRRTHTRPLSHWHISADYSWAHFRCRLATFSQKPLAADNQCEEFLLANMAAWVSSPLTAT